MLHMIKLPYTDRLPVVLEYRAEVAVHIAVVRCTEDGHQVWGYVGDVMTPKPTQPHQSTSAINLRFATWTYPSA